MNVDWNVIITGLLAPVTVLIVHTILDFKLASTFVKYFSWIPVRGISRIKPPKISGKWQQLWEAADSAGFKDAHSRQSHPVIKQFGSYCYTEFISAEITYVVFGKIVNEYFVGDWFDQNDPHGYFGTFQLQIVNSNSMKGKWIGHSKSNHDVKADEWNWKKLV